MDSKTFALSAKCGNLDNMKWLKENDCPFGDDTFKSAAEFGNLDNMNWLKENDCPWSIIYPCEAECLKTEVIQWFKENDYPWIL